MFEEVPGHPNHVAMARRNLVRSLLELGRLAEAQAELDAASALSRRESDETSIIVLRGELRRREGKLAEALSDHAAAASRTEAAEPSRRLDPLSALAETNVAAARWAEASAAAERAAAIARSIHGDSSCRLAPPLRLQAEALLGAGRPSEALPLAERALGLVKPAQLDPLAVARAELAVARALPEAERERARRLAAAARDKAAGDGRDPEIVARIDAWLARAP